MNTKRTQNKKSLNNFIQSPAYLAFRFMQAWGNKITSPVIGTQWKRKCGYLYLSADSNPKIDTVYGVYGATFLEALKYMIPQTHNNLQGFIGLFSPSAPKTSDCVILGERGWRSAGASLVYVVEEFQTRNFGLPTIKFKEIHGFLESLEVRGYPQIPEIINSVAESEYTNIVNNMSGSVEILYRMLRNAIGLDTILECDINQFAYLELYENLNPKNIKNLYELGYPVHYYFVLNSSEETRYMFNLINAETIVKSAVVASKDLAEYNNYWKYCSPESELVNEYIKIVGENYDKLKPLFVSEHKNLSKFYDLCDRINEKTSWWNRAVVYRK